MLAVPTDVLQLVLMLLLRAKRAVMGSQPDEDAVRRIAITTGRRDGTLVLTVEDSGRRIDGDGGAARRHLSSPAGNAHRPGGGAPRPGRSGAPRPGPRRKAPGPGRSDQLVASSPVGAPFANTMFQAVTSRPMMSTTPKKMTTLNHSCMLACATMKPSPKTRST